MEVHTVRADNVLQLAQSFRDRVTKTGDARYNHIMLLTAIELEVLAERLLRRRCTEPEPCDYVS
ncbi:hypothetical protein FHS83_000596 [Rhizomicrobium palustre]|jgi:hypothetical protein|uniref:Uncharacterized protein n=1 Tax=Rhizomicrobium palustre TaxID=189966 RepID=A0A846MUT2_9PROT|nr:hypothetical protein [Rhizomicrobium palustre]NIK87278.1 hypothetical protein [Rhizomicrobium palustre]